MNPSQKTIIIHLMTVCVLICFWCDISQAGRINPGIIQDLSPISGYIVKIQSPETMIIDLDASDGITTGDLFSVIVEKESLTHPVTETVIGRLNDVKAIVRITQIRDGYAFSKLIKYTQKKASIKPGDRVIRYDQMRSQFTDHSGNGKHIYTNLLKQLPHLKWRAYAKKKNPEPTDLNLIYDHKGLEIKDTHNRLLHFYPHSEIYVPSVMPMDAYQSFEMSGLYENIRTIGKVKGLVYAADFLLMDNSLFMATATNDHIAIYQITSNKVQLVEKQEIPLEHQPISASWWRPTSISKPHLTITYWHNQDIESKVYVLKNQKLSGLAYGINYHLGGYDTNHDGNPETLLGQPIDREYFWDNQLFRLQYFDNALRLFNRFKSPNSFCTYGSVIGDLTNDGFLENIWVRNGVLRIYAGKSFLYKTYVGNSPGQQITYDIDPTSKRSLFRNISIYPRPVMADLIDNDGLKELYVIHSERPLLSHLGLTSQALKTWIKCIRYQNDMFFSQRVSQIFNTNIQALTVFHGDFIVLLRIEDRDTDQRFTKVIRWKR